MSDSKSFWNPYAQLEPSQRRWLGVGAVLAVLIVWSVLAGSGLVGANKLPAPWQVAKALTYLIWDGERQTSLLLTATLWSVGRVLAAGGLVLMIGIPVGVLMGASPRVNALLSPLIDPFRSAPVVALLPIMVMWFGIGEWMKILFLFVGAVVYLIPMVRDAVRAVPQAYWISARDLGATPWEAVRHSVLPLSMPRIADAVIVSVSVMWTYITVAEYVNAQEGLGQLIQNARRFSAMDQVFAGIIVIIALALATYQGMQFAKRRLYPWETQL
ncbi:ABC-type nitrate/sulfonate/bicarbonate transport system permease component [Chitinivorax tropicus]|uniref:ABC-type nitrate/sulfonate/bicarbonate transport system permease component n=1 Tax=Chitinivorax tropicus TaxID=714531 RepID=A0A840MID3_9PROT|nr:ABC transporter permease [Chitinivorax tropicus]MBB5017275.1 ABC-type nitrate/sulfonate/bicarbonate transport system permease component [Chitinivorax tropicus]